MIRQIQRLTRQRRVALLFPALWLFLSFASVDTTTDSLKSTATSKIVLIAKSDSYLENAVSGILTDSLSAKGFSIKIISLETLEKQRSGNYRATIVMNAIQSSKEQRVVRAYTRALGADQSKILVFTVYGEEWKTGKVVGDAVTGATKKLNPAFIAEKILKRLEAIAEIK
jgi:hypothetical protein